MRAPCAHSALFYGEPDEFVAGIEPFLSEGLAAGDHVIVGVTPDKQRWLREALGADAQAVEWVDAGALYGRNGVMFTAVHELLRRHATPGRGRLRLVAEQDFAARDVEDARAYMRYEAIANVVYRDFDAAVLCPYDGARLPDRILDAARKTHPEVATRGRAHASIAFTDPRAYVRRHSRVVEPPARAHRLALERSEDLASARAMVRTHARSAGLDRAGAEDTALAVTEVATNALRHGEPPCTLAVYVADDRLVCQVRDAGAGPDPLAGYLPPVGGASGYGLWLAHQLCDTVEVTSEEDGTTVSLRTRLAARA